MRVAIVSILTLAFIVICKGVHNEEGKLFQFNSDDESTNADEFLDEDRNKAEVAHASKGDHNFLY